MRGWIRGTNQPCRAKQGCYLSGILLKADQHKFKQKKLTNKFISFFYFIQFMWLLEIVSANIQKNNSHQGGQRKY
jgi:hypothetical protein